MLIYPNSILATFRSFQQIKSFGFILNSLPYLSFEENVAFKKEKYFEAGGFGQHVNEHFANLELVINDFIRKKKTTINFCSDTAIKKEMCVSKDDFFELLIKELRIREKLSWSKRFVLYWGKTLTILFYPAAIFTVLNFIKLWPVFTGLILIYIIAFAFIIKISLNRLNERKLFLSSLGYALFMPIFKSGFQVFYRYSSRCQQKWKSKK